MKRHLYEENGSILFDENEAEYSARNIVTAAVRNGSAAAIGKSSTDQKLHQELAQVRALLRRQEQDLRETNHRLSNSLQMAAVLLRLQSVRQGTTVPSRLCSPPKPGLSA